MQQIQLAPIEALLHTGVLSHSMLLSGSSFAGHSRSSLLSTAACMANWDY